MKLLSILAGLLILFSPAYSLEDPKAAWATHGIMVNDTRGNTPQQNPKIILDGAGGYLIAWEDGRSGHYNIYLQKIDESGALLWERDGVAAAKTDGNQNFSQLIDDGAQGTIIVWQDYRNGNSDIYAQRIGPQGKLIWDKDGVPVCRADAGQFAPEITSDRSGGAIITWHDYRGGKGEDIYAQRIDGEGRARWKEDGIAISTGPGTQWYPKIASDGSGGAIIAWTDGRISASDNNIYAQRLGPQGDLLWEKEGVPVSAALGNQERPVIMTSDTGAIIAWNDSRSGNNDIYLQKIDQNGRNLWDKDGVAACRFPLPQEDPKLAPDGSGGAVVTWTDYRDEKGDIYAQRIGTDGKTLWQENGRPLSVAEGIQKNPEIVKLKTEDWVIVWEDARKGRLDLYAQKINSAGIPLWQTNGVSVASELQSRESPAVISGPEGNIIIAWEDKRTGNYDVHAQKISRHDGTALWGKDSVVICAAIGSVVQQNMDLIITKYDEIILVFEDARSGFFNVYAQKITRAGELAWGTDGIPIARVLANQTNPRLVPDAEGGAIIAWEDHRIESLPSIRTQRIDRSGRKAWASSTIAANSLSRQVNPIMVSDGKGGAIIAWQDSRNILNLQDIYAQKVSASGGLLWGEKGKAVIAANGDQVDVEMIGDNAGGAILAWTDYRRGDRNPDIYAQRIDTIGSPLWGEEGTTVCGAPDVQRQPRMISDGSEGAILAWTDKGGGSYDIYAQRVSSVGKPLWMKDGIPLNQSSRTQQAPRFGSKNVLVWEDYRYGNWDIFAGAFDLSGKPLWDPKGVPVAMIPHTQYSPQIATLKDGSTIISWEDYRSGLHYEIFVQKLDANGLPAWQESGFKVNTMNGGRGPKVAVSEAGDSFYVFWEDYTGGGRAIYGQRFLLN